jgi:hypothetical protein
MSIVRSGFLAMVCLAIGFAAGWQLKRSSFTPAMLLANSHSPIEPAAVAKAKPPIEPTSKSQGPSATAGATRLAAPSLSEHLAIIRWLKENGLLSYVGFFSGGQITREFVSIYGLTSSETAELGAASRLAKEKLEEMALQRVKLDPTSNKKKLSVTIPAFPEEGGQVYDALMSRISSVLGPDRYALLDEISGTSLDQEFDGFGLTRNRYEVVVEATPGGSPIYKTTSAYVYDAINYRSYNGSPSGTSSGGSTNITTSAADVLKLFPFLKSFALPSVPSGEFRQPSGPDLAIPQK